MCTHRLPTPCRREPAFVRAEPDAPRSAGPYVPCVRCGPVRLAHQNPLLEGQNLAGCVPRGSSHRPLRVGRLTRGAHLWCTVCTHHLPTPCRREPAFVRAEPDAWRSIGAHVHLVRIAPVRLTHRNPLLNDGTSSAAFLRHKGSNRKARQLSATVRMSCRALLSAGSNGKLPPYPSKSTSSTSIDSMRSRSS